MKQQRGVALITAILIMALTTTLVFALEWDNSLDLRRTYVSIYREEGIQAALGAETWVRGILLDDLDNSTTDHLDEIWATEIPGLPIESDSIQGQIFGQVRGMGQARPVPSLDLSSPEVHVEPKLINSISSCRITGHTC